MPASELSHFRPWQRAGTLCYAIHILGVCAEVSSRIENRQERDLHLPYLRGVQHGNLQRTFLYTLQTVAGSWLKAQEGPLEPKGCHRTRRKLDGDAHYRSISHTTRSIHQVTGSEALVALEDTASRLESKTWPILTALCASCTSRSHPEQLSSLLLTFLRASVERLRATSTALSIVRRLCNTYTTAHDGGGILEHDTCLDTRPAVADGKLKAT